MFFDNLLSLESINQGHLGQGHTGLDKCMHVSCTSGTDPGSTNIQAGCLFYSGYCARQPGKYRYIDRLVRRSGKSKKVTELGEEGTSLINDLNGNSRSPRCLLLAFSRITCFRPSS